MVERWAEASGRAADTVVGVVVLTAFWLVGEGITYLLPASPLPGSLWGMVILFLALSSGRLPERRIRRGAALLVRWLGLLFVPVGVGVVAYGELVLRFAGAIALSIVLGSLLTLLGTGIIAAWVARRRGHGTQASE